MPFSSGSDISISRSPRWSIITFVVDAGGPATTRLPVLTNPSISRRAAPFASDEPRKLMNPETARAARSAMDQRGS